MPQLIGLAFAMIVIAGLVEYVVLPLLLYLGQVLLIALMVFAAAAALSWLSALVYRHVTGTPGRSSATHRASVEPEGSLLIEANYRRAPAPRNDGFALVAGCSWLVSLLGMALLATPGPMEIFKNVLAPFWLTFAAVGGASGFAFALATSALHRMSGWAGRFPRAPLRNPIPGWRRGLDDAARADRAFSSMGVRGCFDLRAHISSMVDTQQAQVLADPDLVFQEFAAQRARIAELADLAERGSVRWQQVDAQLRETARAVFANRSRSCLSQLDDLQVAHRNAAGLLLKGDWTGFERDMDDLEADALDLQAVAACDPASDSSSSDEGVAADAFSRAHDVLGIPVGHPLDKVKDIARRLLQTYHPDKGLVGGDDRRFKEIQQALETIIRNS